jgi:hypothetical protein
VLFHSLHLKQEQQGTVAPVANAVRENSGAGLYGDYSGYGMPSAYGLGMGVGADGYGMGIDGGMESWPGAVAGVGAADSMRGELAGGGHVRMEGVVGVPGAGSYFAVPMQYGHQQPHLRGAAHMVAVLSGGAPPVLPHPVLPRVPHGAAAGGAVVAGYMQGVAAGRPGSGGALGRADGRGQGTGVGAGASALNGSYANAQVRVPPRISERWGRAGVQKGL